MSLDVNRKMCNKYVFFAEIIKVPIPNKLNIE